MYTNKNYRTKKQLKEDIKNGVKVGYYQPGPLGTCSIIFGGNETREGKITLEGPHYPEAHKWYASAVVKDGYIIKVS